MKIYLETLGCQMNRLDSELVCTLLRRAGHDRIDSPRSADVVLYNTCSVRQHAEDKVYSRLGADAQRKSAKATHLVGVLGCMAQREGEDLARRYPAVDILCSPGQLHRLPELIEQAARGERAVALDPSRRADPDLRAEAALDAVDLWRDPQAVASEVSAFVRVMRGCDKFCSYCIVPHVRGRQRSRDPEEIEREVRALLEAGRSEITLLGQTVNGYRHEDDGRLRRFSDLLRRLADLPGLRRLRFVTSHPIDFGEDILHAIAEKPALCPFIHIPAQSGSDAVLKRMNRGYTRAEYDALLDAARQIVPDVAIVSDLITGFSGETDDDHAATVDLIGRSQFKNSYIFKYSPRPGTHAAATLPDSVPETVKRQRNAELLDAQREAGLAHHRRYLGRTVEVLVAGPSPKAGQQPAGNAEAIELTGRSRGDHVVIFHGPADLAGRYVDVRIADANSLTLFGEWMG